ncbi:uncharacterized protein B0H18DRAFT_67211 [Fomitopsis serialis]|uniref:uncharacterized protein n=1 Tax=Fomitopsis serialis TaxID=139415 RepID=UPI0020073E9F|nr:uncharacterized protein B0H18DRAFT_67211 [Neoantrodia serialis]KAH9931796.1 hypothetical protein B0H18DRAFT_67211 [Neoantrodia serialis]
MPVLTANQAGYSAAAALTMLTWDLLVNLDDEIEYVWRWPKGWLKGMYCFIRYLPLIGETTFFSLIQRFQRREMLASSTCLSIDVAEYFVLQAVAAAVAIISILRVYVLYDRSKWLLLFLAPIFVACAGISVTGIAKYRTAYTFTGSCLTTYEPDFVLIGWMLPVTFELILFLLVFYKFLQNIRSASHLAGQPVLLVFLRDGIAAFLAIFTVTCVTVASSVAFVELSSGFFYWNMTVYSIAGSHVLLNLREVVTRTGYPSTMASSTESNSIEFKCSQVSRGSATRVSGRWAGRSRRRSN